MNTIRLVQILKKDKEVETLRLKEVKSRHQKIFNFSQPFTNLSRPSGLLKKQSIHKSDHNILQFLDIQYGTQLPVLKEQSIMKQSKIHTRKVPQITSKVNLIQKSNIEAPHFISSILANKPSEVKNVVRNFLAGIQVESPSENMASLYQSSKVLYESARDMANKMSLDEVDQEDVQKKEFDILQNKTFSEIKHKSRLFQQKHLIFENIDQKGDKNYKTQRSGIKLFIPKNEIQNLMDHMQDEAEKDSQQKQQNVIIEKQKQTDQFLEKMRKYKENLQEMVYTVQKLKKIKVKSEMEQRKDTHVVKFLMRKIDHTQDFNKKDLWILGNKKKSIEMTKSTKMKTYVSKECYDEEYKQELKCRLTKALKGLAYKLNKLNLTFDDVGTTINNIKIVYGKAFPHIPFEHEGSHQFIQNVKDRNIEQVKASLKRYRFYVYDYDTNMKTGLHHAASQNDMDMISILIDYGADLDNQDMIGRTALHIACQKNNILAVQILIRNQANPYTTSISGKTAGAFSNNIYIRAIISHAKKFHFMMALIPQKDKKFFWTDKAAPFFNQQNMENYILFQTYKFQLAKFGASKD